MSASKRELELRHKKAQQRVRLILILLLVPAVAAATGGAIVIVRGQTLQISPTDAANSAIVNKVAGVGWFWNDTVYRLAGAVDVEVSAPGFFAEQVRISGDNPGKYLVIEMREIPATMVAYAEPSSDETVWLLDGQHVGTGPFYETQLTPGSYELTADNSYFELNTQTLQLDRDQSYEVDFALEPIHGEANIRSMPAGAQVAINGQAVGASNLKVSLPGGRYSITVTKENHATVRDQIEITRPRPNPRRSYQLSANPSFAIVTVSPAGGNLLLDGSPIQPGRRIDVTPRTRHIVSYDLAGFHTRTQEITLRPGESRRINMSLNANQGIVAIESTPSAQVQINGRIEGTTPMSLELPAMEHQITISKLGYMSHNQTVLPTSSRAMKIKVNLTSEKDHRLRTSPARYQNQVGMQMVLFHPQAYTKGSPRGSPHRRPNEAEHTVRLSRPFYSAAHEVSLGQFQKSGISVQGQPRYPVTNVSWDVAAQYCNWLSSQENLQPVYQFGQGHNRTEIHADMHADGYRMLTESEWEWLARKAGRRRQVVYEWGDEDVIPPQAGNFADVTARAEVHPEPHIARYNDGFPRLAPIGSFPAGPSGLFDLSGNAAEWVHDVYKLIPNSEQPVDPAGPMSHKKYEEHVVKGSSWRTAEPEQLRPAYREPATAGRDDLGFRVARYLYKEI